MSAIPGLVAMNPVTAVAFLLAGLALQLIYPAQAPLAHRRAGQAAAAAVALIAPLCLSRFVTPWELGPDRLIFSNRLLAAPGGLPNRMAPNTALGFVLLGLALLFLDARSTRVRRHGEMLALVGGGLGLAAIVGYAYDSRVLYGVASFIPMALNTALGLLILAAGVLCARPRAGLPTLFAEPGPGSLLARRLLPAALAVPLVLGWLHLRGEAAGLYDAAAGTALLVTATTLVIVSLIYRSAVRLNQADLARSQAEVHLRALTGQLETRVAERTDALQRLNQTLAEEIAERVATDQALAAQTEFLRQVIDANPGLVFVTDREGRFTLANRAVADLLGTTVSALDGAAVATAGQFAVGAVALFAADQEVMRTRQVKEIAEAPATDARTGQVRWFSTIKVPLVDPDGSCHRTLGVCSEITARRHAKLELRRVSHELSILFDAAPLAICRIDSDGRVHSWNRAAEQLFGWRADEVTGHLPPNIPPDQLGEYGRLRGEVLAGRPLTDLESKRLHRDGRLIDVSISAAALRDASGQTSGIVVIYKDITARKDLEAQLRQAQKMEAVGRLAGGVAHDFNNLLTVIETAAGCLLADLDAGDPRRIDVVEIEGAAVRAAALTRQLLAFSRRQVLQPRVLDLNAVVTGIEPLVRRLVEENIEVAVRLGAGLDRVKADPSQLDEVILNLVVNARDAMPNGGTLLIETANVMLDGEDHKLRATVRPGPHVLLRVTDTGCGMDVGTQARIFEPFFTTKPVGQGTGLGLSTVYGVVKQSGGHVWVYSEVGRGTTFKIYFPRHAGPTDLDAKPEVCQAPRGARPAGATVLLVEDDDAVRGSVQRVLERHGYRVQVASQSQEALAALAPAGGGVDLVLADMVMPGMSGLELRRRLRATYPGMPVLLMSGYSEEAITRLGEEEDTGPLIEKPFTVQGILDKVQAMLTGEVPNA
ncbi:MAG TPA: PAS domain-containing protein [Gemmatimonadales bacterium]|nr:PAS domain-containing protein [Gemmatimonadales bacterium]